jgi:hypothetical protein
MKINIKKLLESKAGKVILRNLRGLIRINPAGNAAIDIVENIATIFKNKKGLGENKIQLPHSWNAILVEIIGVGIIIYAYYTKIITVEQLKQFVELILNNLS